LYFIKKTHPLVLATKLELLRLDKKEKMTRADIKSMLKLELIMLLDDNGFPPVVRDEVYMEVFEQAENYKKFRL
jgi:type I restriction enzyme, R subunit